MKLKAVSLEDAVALCRHEGRVAEGRERPTHECLRMIYPGGIDENAELVYIASVAECGENVHDEPHATFLAMTKRGKNREAAVMADQYGGAVNRRYAEEYAARQAQKAAMQAQSAERIQRQPIAEPEIVTTPETPASPTQDIAAALDTPFPISQLGKNNMAVAADGSEVYRRSFDGRLLIFVGKEGAKENGQFAVIEGVSPDLLVKKITGGKAQREAMFARKAQGLPAMEIAESTEAKAEDHTVEETPVEAAKSETADAPETEVKKTLIDKILGK